MQELILKYFPDISPEKLEKFEIMGKLYPELNEKVNVISRKDIGNLDVNHILHSLSIAKFLPFREGTEIMDLGTGGGFPGLPLAVMFPDSHFHLIDRIGKKIAVAEEIARVAGIENVTFRHGDSGECKQKVDFVVSRAVMPQKDLINAIRKNISHHSFNSIPNGLISLKGGDLAEELKGLGDQTKIVDINQYFTEPFFETKKIVYTPI